MTWEIRISREIILKIFKLGKNYLVNYSYIYNIKESFHKYGPYNKFYEVSHFLNILGLPFHLSSHILCDFFPSSFFSSDFFIDCYLIVQDCIDLKKTSFRFSYLNDRVQKIVKSKGSCLKNLEKNRLD